jgi:formylglycine-generating enzyme required for sulfatase activity
MPASTPATELLADPLLRSVPVIRGLKVLAGTALYARVGQGGMGVVYRGRHCLLDVDMAVKVLKPSLLAEDERFALRFRREAQVAARITHQNVIRLYECNQQHGLHWLLMEFVDGESARGRVVRKGPLPEAEALAILLGAAQGLAEAHRAGIVHRDVKPDNLLIARDGRVKVADLGLVRREGAGGDSISLESGIMGTPQYMAPEQWDSPDVTAAADVWALGAVLWFLLVGDHAIAITTLAAAARRVQEHDFPTLRGRRDDVRPEVHALLARCTARRPAERFTDARDLVAALLPLVAGGEERLRDDEAGLGGSRPALPTPPSRELIAAIRDAIGTGTQVAGSDRDRGEAPTVVSPDAAVPERPPGTSRRRGGLVAALLAGGLLGGWYGYENGWFDAWLADPEWESTMRLARARTLWAEAQQLVTQATGLDAAIDKLEEVVALQPGFGEARQKLAAALGERVERALANDGWNQANADGAFLASRRAVELAPDDPAVQQRHTRAGDNLAAAISICVTGPELAAIVDAGARQVEGTVRWDGITAITVNVAGPAGTVGVRAPVFGGTFRATVDLPPGPCRIFCGFEDRHGVAGITIPATTFAIGWTGPSDGLANPASMAAVVVHNGAGITMRPVPVRPFTMGAAAGESDDDDLPARPIVMQNPFWLGATEVTRAQWIRVMGTTPWTAGPADPSDEPAIEMSWAMADRFCAALNDRERAAGRVPDGWSYVLPTEAQWELAARGGDQRTWPHGDDEAGLAAGAVFGDAARPPQPVASLAPNALGFHDLAGNVAEWCADVVPSGNAVERLLLIPDAQEPIGKFGSHRVHRGGHHGSPAADCRCAARVVVPADAAGPTIGFRVALARR